MTELINKQDAVAPCPFCAAKMRVEEKYFMHPGTVTDEDCILSGRAFYWKYLNIWNQSLPAANDGIEGLAERLYTAYADNDEAIHCNRFAAWHELTPERQKHWQAVADAVPAAKVDGDLVERLLDCDRNSVQRMNGSDIFGEAATAIQQLKMENEGMRGQGFMLAVKAIEYWGMNSLSKDTKNVLNAVGADLRKNKDGILAIRDMKE